MLNDSERLRLLSEIISAVCRAHGLELVDARFYSQRGIILKVIIERFRYGEESWSSGVSLADCQAVSQDLSTALDVHAELAPPGEFHLEVSSPGIERPLFKLKDYERFQGREVRIQTLELIRNRRRFQGRLLAVAGDDIRIEQDGIEVTIPYTKIKKANLVYRF
ncbi:MAG: ribosome maturation factor RimP [Deltaproteobacteria bacterium]|nr:ribosome maturation factor RimP [Deltaproteobacteria bacterium]